MDFSNLDEILCSLCLITSSPNLEELRVVVSYSNYLFTYLVFYALYIIFGSYRMMWFHCPFVGICWRYCQGCGCRVFWNTKLVAPLFKATPEGEDGRNFQFWAWTRVYKVYIGKFTFTWGNGSFTQRRYSGWRWAQNVERADAISSSFTKSRSHLLTIILCMWLCCILMAFFYRWLEAEQYLDLSLVGTMLFWTYWVSSHLAETWNNWCWHKALTSLWNKLCSLLRFVLISRKLKCFDIVVLINFKEINQILKFSAKARFRYFSN